MWLTACLKLLLPYESDSGNSVTDSGYNDSPNIITIYIMWTCTLHRWGLATLATMGTVNKKPINNAVIMCPLTKGSLPTLHKAEDGAWQQWLQHFQNETEESGLPTVPCGSTSLAIFRASELARSEFAGVMASMRQFSLLMNSISIDRIWISMSGGWSPTGTLVMPGRSISVRFNTITNHLSLQNMQTVSCWNHIS